MWRSGLCGCFSNFSLCVLSSFAAPLAIGKNAASVGENPVLWVIAVQAAPCIAGAYLRGLIRKKEVSTDLVILLILSAYRNDNERQDVRVVKVLAF